MSDIVIAGATYPSVPSIVVPKSGGGTATYVEGDTGYSPSKTLFHVKTDSGCTVYLKAPESGGWQSIYMINSLSQHYHLNADGGADVYHQAASDEYGQWEIYAKKNSLTSTSSFVTINSAKQYDVDATLWNGIFYDNGDEYSDFTGGWSKVSAQGSITKNATNIFITATSNSVAASGAASTVNGFNLSNYSTLWFTITATGTYYSRVGLTNTQGGYLDDAWVSGYFEEFTSKGTQVTVSIDLTGLPAGIYYPTIRTRATSAGLRLYKAWVTR